MAQSQHQPGSALRNWRGQLPDSSGEHLEWVAVDRKLAPGWSSQRDGDIPAVLEAWRMAERSLALQLEAGPEREELTAQVNVLRAEYQRLFKAAIKTPRPVGPKRSI